MIYLIVYFIGVALWVCAIGFVVARANYKVDSRDIILALGWPLTLPLCIGIAIGLHGRKRK